MRFLITGCGRSGTTYMAELLRNAGLEVAHEAPGPQGSVSWYEGWRDDLPVSYQVILHQVREPIVTIESMHTCSNHTWDLVCQHTPTKMSDPVLLKCMKYWHYWNLMTERKARLTYRVEDLDTIVRVVLPMLGVRLSPEKEHEIRGLPGLNSRRNLPEWKVPSGIKYQDLVVMDDKLAEQIRIQARRYGYLL